MHSYTVHRAGANTGPFTEEEIRAKLAAGEIAATDLAWRPGVPDWKPLATRLAEDSGENPPPLPAGVPPTFSPVKKAATNGALIAVIVAACFFCGIAFIGILASLAIPALKKARNAAMEKILMNDARQVSAAWNQRCIEKHAESATVGDIRQLLFLATNDRLAIGHGDGSTHEIDLTSGGTDGLRLVKGDRIVIMNAGYRRDISSNPAVRDQDSAFRDGIVFDLETGRPE